jgi:hypothetical protein
MATFPRQARASSLARFPALSPSNHLREKTAQEEEEVVAAVVVDSPSLSPLHR